MPSAEATYMSGVVKNVKYHNGDFYILRMFLDDPTTQDLFGITSTKEVTVKGDIPGMSVGSNSWFGFTAVWERDPKYGRQLKIVEAPVIQDGWSPFKAARALCANGVSSVLMQQVWDHFGDDDLIPALSDAEKLRAVPGLAKFSANLVASRWEFVQAHFGAMNRLSSMGLPKRTRSRILKHFGSDANMVLSKHPWRLLEVPGVTFGHAQAVARSLGIHDREAEVEAAVLYTVKNNRGFGHLYTTTGHINHALYQYLDAETKEITRALVALHKRGDILIDRKTVKGVTAVYDPVSYKVETESAKLLVARNQAASLIPGEKGTDRYIQGLGAVGPATKALVKTGKRKGRLERVARASIEEWGSQAKLSLSEMQKEGVFNALVSPISILGGLPGTGKTTSLLAVVRILQDAEVHFLLCAPTGIAAKNLSARTGARASTIHRAFSAKGSSKDNKRERSYEGVVGEGEAASLADGTEEWGYGPDNPHPADVIVIDEASMVDQHLLYRLLTCTKPTARIVFVGDYAQLPSVGPGNVLRDLINAEVFPTVKLEQIFRQGDTSGIVYAAHAMHKGEVPEPDKDFRFFPKDTEEEVLGAVLKVAQRLYESRHKTQRTFQVLSPKHRGTVGVTNLNNRLRELLNPASPGLAEARIGSWNIREGDRVMVIRNRYGKTEDDPDIFNGDVGKVSRVEPSKEEMVLRVFGQPPMEVPLEFKDVPSLVSLAYATTVHKSQGLEYDYIILPMVKGFHHQLQRNLIYTAITRARIGVFVIGEWSALCMAVHNSKEDARMTLFRERLVGGLSA